MQANDFAWKPAFVGHAEHAQPLPAVTSYSSHFLPPCISHSAASYTNSIPVVFIDFLAPPWIPEVENFLPGSGWEVTLDLHK